MSVAGEFTTVRVVGPMLPPDLLGRVIAADKDLSGLTPSDYHLGAGETPREAANRAWSYLRGVWANFRTAVDALPATDPALGLTREKWLLVLLRELGYGRVPATPAGGLVADDRAFPVSHLWGPAPMHLLGWNVALDKRAKGVPGAAESAPHAMLQELINREDRYLWAVVSNGRVLRVLRDSTSLAGQSYLEFDLEAMFDGEVFSDFVLLYLMVHQSRVEILTPDGPASDCWLERWRTASIESGTRALGLLRDGVQQAISVLGTGFLAHPANADLRRRLDTRRSVEPRFDEQGLSLAYYHRSLLRLVYRLLFLFVAEDRGALLIAPPSDAPAADLGAAALAKDRYTTYFSTGRLRRLALRRRGTRHGDLWEGLSLVIDALGRDEGRPELGIPGLGGLFDHGPADVVTGQSLANDALLAAIRHLSVVQPRGQAKRKVDYRNLGAEELGSIYESLLELVPRHDPVERTFTLENLAGNDRKNSGSYYTPSSLIDLLLDEALDPLLDDAVKNPDPEAALLALTVCDPACGSGHFLVAAARRIAARLARVRSRAGFDPFGDPSPGDLQVAMHDVVARCIYGVDLNLMAAELARVSLWLEALQPGRPLTFLDAHIKVGNALLGATPALLAAGIPDAAYAAIEGDEKKWAAALRKRNRAEADLRAARDEHLQLEPSGFDVSNRPLRTRLADLERRPILSLADAHLARVRYVDYGASPELDRARRLADTWCAAFVQRKVQGAPAITDEVLRAVADGTEHADVRAEVAALAARYRFFHWHLEFPTVFDTDGTSGSSTGWTGGFAATVGNPPWERVKLQEQEFFSSRDARIAGAANSAARKKLIAALPGTDPALWDDWVAAKRAAEGESHLLRDTARYPFCGVGDVNTYSVFAEHMRTVIAPAGRMGIITPTGLATDATTAAFFADTLRAERLAAFYDFDNEAKIFPNVHHAFRFAASCLTGGEPVDEARLAFVTRHVADVPTSRFALAPSEILLLNPNTGTLPLFRSRIDADITLGIYRRHPVLIRDGALDGNPWGLRFGTLFHMANDSGLFETGTDLAAAGVHFDGWAWTGGGARRLPLYEAKLLSHYDHRYSTYADATQAQLNVGTLPRLTPAQHDDPEAEPLARYWVAEAEVSDAIGGRWDREWLLGWRNITNTGNERTFVPSVFPRTGMGHAFPIALIRLPFLGPVIQAVWSSLAFDYLARQKLSGTNMTFGIVSQLSCPAPATFEEPTAWTPGVTLAAWIRPRVLELTYTSRRIAPYARDVLGLPSDADPGPPFRWIPERRDLLRAELDAAMFHVYGLDRAEAEHVLDSFFVVRKYEERDHGEFRTKRLVLDRHDALAHSMTSGDPYESPLDPAPGTGPRHPLVTPAHQAG